MHLFASKIEKKLSKQFQGSTKEIPGQKKTKKLIVVLPEFGFEFLGLIHAVVDKSETGGFSTTEVGSESKSENTVSGALVHLGQFFTNFSLWD